MKTLLLAAVVFLSLSAQADILERINGCERVGGGSCVFAILRELARPQTPLLILKTGAYQQTTTSDLCKDQYAAPVYEEGRLVAVRMGWCGVQYKAEYACNGNACSRNGAKITIMSPDRYLFENQELQKAEFVFVSSPVDSDFPIDGVPTH